MSERKVREAAKRLLSEKMTIWSSDWTQGSPNDQLKQALSEPPDVVVLAQELLKMHRGTAGRREVVVITGGALRSMLEQKFHVRLTADGWEWVEEGE